MYSRKTTSFIVSFLFIAARVAVSQPAQTFGDFIQRIAAEAPSMRSAIVDSFMIAQTPRGFPVTTDSMAYFVFRGKVDSSIAVTGDHTQWSPKGDSMINVSATNLYYFTQKFEPDARIDYKFIRDGNWILDPLNPHVISGGFGKNSELAMPSYLKPAVIQVQPCNTARHALDFYFQEFLYRRQSKGRGVSSTALRLIADSLSIAVRS